MIYPPLILREFVDPNYTTKGDVLTFEELDKNLKYLGDALAALSETDTSSFDDYDPSFTYQGGETYYVAYGGNIWKFVSLIDRSGITPGTDDTIWELSSSGAFSHERNKDEYLSQGTVNEVSAVEIREFIDNYSGGKEITDATNIGYLEDDDNWTSNRYTGPALTGQNPGDWYINNSYDYKIGTIASRRIPYAYL